MSQVPLIAGSGMSGSADLSVAVERATPMRLEDVVAGHREWVARLAHRLTGWSDESQDIVQEVMVRALMGAGRFRGEADVRTWLTRITINCCRSQRRRRWVRRVITGGRWTGDEDAVGMDLAAGGDEVVEQRERAAAVRRAVAGLGARYREAVVLHYLEGMEIEEVGRVLGMSANAVAVRLHRARGMLRGTLGKWMGEGE